MEFTVKIEPEDIGRMMGAMLSSCPPDVRQQFIDAAITAGPKMYAEFLKSSGVTLPIPTQIDFKDPFWAFKMFQGMTGMK
jgi:hypothetical protein